MTNVPSDNFLPGLALMIAGGGVGDFNRDGWQDLFVLSGGDAPDRLYINNQDGTFTDQAAAWGVDRHHLGCGVAIGDFNGDGWLDMYVTSFGDADGSITNGEHLLYKHNGDMRSPGFVEIAQQAGVATSDSVPNGFSSAFGDYDLDGDLDLFVTGWFTNGQGGNRLFRNNGDETFTDVSVEAGVFDSEVHGFSPRFVDMDGDRYPELTLAADFGTSRYYVNNTDGTFSDQTIASGTGLDDNGMGSTIGDFNADGMLDWYVTNIYIGHTNPGNPSGNRLYMATSEHQFEELAQELGAIDGAWGWGTVAVDMDHDGDQDIVEVNGFMDGDLQPDKWSNQPARLFVNDGEGSFTEEAAACGLTHTGQGRGLLNADLDNDGDQDLVVFSYAEPLEVYRNDAPADRGWLRIELATGGNPSLAPDGFGTRLWVSAGGLEQVRYVDGGANYLSQSELTAHFGVGNASTIDEIRVEWADGSLSVLCDQAINQHMLIESPPQSLSPADLNASGNVDVLDLLELLGQWGACGACCPADIDHDDTVGTLDLLAVLGDWG